VLIPSPRVTDSRTQNLVFRRPCSFLWFFIVSYYNYGGDSKLFFYKFYLLVRLPVAISVATGRRWAWAWPRHLSSIIVVLRGLACNTLSLEWFTDLVLSSEVGGLGRLCLSI